MSLKNKVDVFGQKHHSAAQPAVGANFAGTSPKRPFRHFDATAGQLVNPLGWRFPVLHDPGERAHFPSPVCWGGGEDGRCAVKHNFDAVFHVNEAVYEQFFDG